MKLEYKKYPVTYILIALCVIVYTYTSLRYGINLSAIQALEVGGFNPLIVLEQNQYYRLITANFIHYSPMHIFFNIYAIYNLLKLLEILLKRNEVCIVVVVSMITTTLLPFGLYIAFNDGAMSVMAGASGIGYGVMGALGVIGYLYKNRYPNLYKNIAINVIIMFVISISITGISLWGHVGGMLGGAITTYFIITRRKIKRTKILH